MHDPVLMTAAEREEYQGILDDLIAQRTLLRASIKEALANVEIQTYSLTDTEGGQSATRRDPAALQTQLDNLNRQIHFYTQVLQDRLLSFNPRRW
jgi:hypothetical protein